MSGLGNEDFRKLVAESKREKVQQRPKKKADPEKVKSWKKKQQEEQDEDAPKYRDRAEERRRGLNLDYNDLQREVQIRSADWAKLSTDQTKFLGGDMDRAHLVKGLDYALLQKVRKDEESGGAAKAAEAAAAAPAHPKTFATTIGRGVYDALFRPPQSTVAEMFKPRRMAFVYFDEDAELPDGEEPGESSIPYTLVRSKADCPEPREEMNAAVDAVVLAEVVGIMKSVKIESKTRGNKKKGRDVDANLAQVQQEKERHIMNLKLIENPRLATESGAQRPLGGGRDAGGAKPPPTTTAAPGPVDPIFDDVGDDYEVDPGPFRKPSGQQGVPDGPKPYFGRSDDLRDLPAVAQHGTSMGNEREGAAGTAPRALPRPPPGPGGAAVPPGYGSGAMLPPPARDPAGTGTGKGRGFEARMGDRAIVRHKFSKDERRMEDGAASIDATADDIYGVDVLLGAGGLEEEEEDLRDMEKKGGGRVLDRADFATDEQYSRYKSSKEAAPKAAFQFGVKVANGRRSGKDMDRRMANKLDSQLGKIQKVFKDKGFEARGAFTPADGDASATPSRKRARLGI